MFQKYFLDLRICWKELEFNNGTRSLLKFLGQTEFFFFFFCVYLNCLNKTCSFGFMVWKIPFRCTSLISNLPLIFATDDVTSGTSDLESRGYGMGRCEWVWGNIHWLTITYIFFRLRNLSSNDIREIKTDVFSNLTKLTTLYVEKFSKVIF